MEELKLYCPATGELTDTSEYEWDDGAEKGDGFPGSD